MAGSPDIVDVKSLSDHLIYIQGKQTGTTNVILFDSSMKQIGILDVEVAIDTGNLQQNIRSSTGSRGIRVGSSNGRIVISGLASNSVAADRAVQVAKTMVSEGNVVNAMTVAPSQQVMLRVRFLEVARSASREIGVTLGLGQTTRGTEASRPAWARRPRGADLLSARREAFRAVGRRPVLTPSGNPVPRTRFARWQRGTRPSNFQYCGDFTGSLVKIRRPLASRWPVSPAMGTASTLR